MAKYRKRPTVIEAVQYESGGNIKDAEVPDWVWEAFEKGTMKATKGRDPLVIVTLAGDVIASPGDFIIRGVQGELYPCQPDIFKATYEAVLVEDE